MPGLLDAFLNMSPEQNQGLLAGAAKMLELSGPSTVPRSFGQIAGASYGAYNDAVQVAQTRQQQQTLMGLKIQDMQSDVANQQMLRNRQDRISKRLMALYGGLQGAPKLGDAPEAASDSPTATTSPGLINPDGMASALPGGPMLPKIGGPDWLQAYQQQNGLQLPSMQTPSAAQRPAAPRVNRTQQLLERLLSEGDVYASEGDFEGADKRYQAAQRWMPQVDRIDTAWKDGKPVRVITYKDGFEQESEYGAKPDMVELDLGGTKQFVDRTRVQPGQIFKKTPTFADQNAAARLRLDTQQANGSDAGPLSLDAITNAASRYNIDGTLPPMGMGKAGSQGRAAILNRAAELAAAQGLSGSDQRYAQLNNRGDVAARNASVRSFATGRDGQAVQSANTALNHLDTIRQLAEAQKSGDMRAFNQVARMLGSAFGQSAPTNLNAALIMVAPEISKAVVGAGGTGHERDQALQALNPNGSPDQILGATQTMQELFGGRLIEAKRTYERTTKLTDFDTSMLSPAARAVLTRAQQHGSGTNGGKGPGNIPAAAVRYLRQNPQLRNDFDAKFGAGAAASVLGK